MLCRLCKKADGSIHHVVSGCSKLAQKEHERRHDNLGKIVHWKLARNCNFEVGGKWLCGLILREFSSIDLLCVSSIIIIVIIIIIPK